MTKRVAPPSSYRDPFLPTLAAVGIGVLASVGLSACMGAPPVDRSRHENPPPAVDDDKAAPSQVEEDVTPQEIVPEAPLAGVPASGSWHPKVSEDVAPEENVPEAPLAGEPASGSWHPKVSGD